MLLKRLQYSSSVYTIPSNMRLAIEFEHLVTIRPFRRSRFKMIKIVNEMLMTVPRAACFLELIFLEQNPLFRSIDRPRPATVVLLPNYALGCINITCMLCQKTTTSRNPLDLRVCKAAAHTRHFEVYNGSSAYLQGDPLCNLYRAMIQPSRTYKSRLRLFTTEIPTKFESLPDLHHV